MTENTETERQALPLEPYMLRRSQLEQTLHDQARSFDRAILTLSSGAIALSLIFLEKIAPRPLTHSKWFLVTAWALFGLAILSTLASFLTSQAAHKGLIREWDETFQKQRDPDSDAPRGSCAHWTDPLNRASAVLFVAGVGALLLFAIKNL